LESNGRRLHGETGPVFGYVLESFVGTLKSWLEISRQAES
jgi:hypothetical protein